MRKKQRPGELVPKSGIYRVMHESHRLMHEVTLFADDRFPLCRQCKDKVRFELRRAVKKPSRITSGYPTIFEDYPVTKPYILH